MLVHICCAVDSHYFLEKIQEEFPDEKLVGFFYDPNIHPYSEYRLRYLDVEYSCEKLGIPLLEGPYNLEEWLKKVKGMEHNNAVGILANIQAESSFNTAAIGDNGTSGGLFQHHAERFSALQKAVPDWQKNWKGQVDFALSEKEASGYSSIKFQNSQLAADYWVKNFEKPRDMFGESQKRMAYSVAFDQALNVGASTTPATNVSTGQQISQMTADNSTLKKEMQQKKSVVVVNNNNTVLNKLPNKSYPVEVQKTEIEKSNEAQLMWLQRGYS